MYGLYSAIGAWDNHLQIPRHILPDTYLQWPLDHTSPLINICSKFQKKRKDQKDYVRFHHYAITQIPCNNTEPSQAVTDIAWLNMEVSTSNPSPLQIPRQPRLCIGTSLHYLTWKFNLGSFRGFRSRWVLVGSCWCVGGEETLWLSGTSCRHLKTSKSLQVSTPKAPPKPSALTSCVPSKVPAPWVPSGRGCLSRDQPRTMHSFSRPKSYCAVAPCQREPFA